MRLDHVTIAGPSLSRMEAAFRQAGLETEYGGPHSNGVTHMALLGFDDGSYVELISRIDENGESPLWHRQIVEDGGAAAWAVDVDDIEAEVQRLRSAGIPVRGPVEYHRSRPDGAAVEWELAFPGEHPPGAVLPFLIRDRTPRERRVRPSPSVAGSELTGVDSVVIAVRDLAGSLSVFGDACGWEVGDALEADAPDFGARLAHVPGTPVILARPLEAGGRLARRIDRFGESPCAFLIRTRDAAATSRRIGAGRRASDRRRWFGRSLFWMPAAKVAAGGGDASLTLGFIE
jgi:catechol 2,3-dioxygenase-like lactoylglutathione lyase family enzyme